MKSLPTHIASLWLNFSSMFLLQSSSSSTIPAGSTVLFMVVKDKKFALSVPFSTSPNVITPTPDGNIPISSGLSFSISFSSIMSSGSASRFSMNSVKDSLLKFIPGA